MKINNEEIDDDPLDREPTMISVIIWNDVCVSSFNEGDSMFEEILTNINMYENCN